MLQTARALTGPGSFVYALTCVENGRAIIKLGVSDNPLKRLDQLRQQIPFKARTFAMLPMSSRKLAFRMERLLLHNFKPWRTRGEWMQFAPEDKANFNRVVRAVYSDVLQSRDINPHWTKIDVRAVDRQKQATRKIMQRRYAKMGMAQRDFIKNGGRTQA